MSGSAGAVTVRNVEIMQRHSSQYLPRCALRPEAGAQGGLQKCPRGSHFQATGGPRGASRCTCAINTAALGPLRHTRPLPDPADPHPSTARLAPRPTRWPFGALGQSRRGVLFGGGLAVEIRRDGGGGAALGVPLHSPDGRFTITCFFGEALCTTIPQRPRNAPPTHHNALPLAPCATPPGKQNEPSQRAAPGQRTSAAAQRSTEARGRAGASMKGQ